jgi:hypothetical protein
MKRNLDKCMKNYPVEYNKSCSPLVGSKIENVKHGGNNKKLIYMTVTGMQLVMMSLRGEHKSDNGTIISNHLLQDCIQGGFGVEATSDKYGFKDKGTGVRCYRGNE